MKQRIKIYSIIAGIIFLLSGFGKALGMSDFVILISRYGLPLPFLAALCLVIIETALGLLLFFQLWLRKVSGIAIVLIFFVTLIFLYGYLFVNMDDCGCFGAFSWLNMPPIYTFIRNAILLYLLVDIFINSKDLLGNITFVERIAFLVVLCVTSFFIGYTSDSENIDFKYGDSKYEGKTVQETKLGEFITTHHDSTYFVFAFSYTCAHCLNSIENLKEYENSDMVDKVIALAFNGTGGRKFFHDMFHPNFLIMEYEPSVLFGLTNSFPRGYYIKNNRVLLELSGELPCSYVFSRKIAKISNIHVNKTHNHSDTSDK
ncbi:MAG: DoxX family protein [Bacteroidales bacterium]|jgi:uncharacterized membrane protein YphA (DoxX/SURF4 family)|nr:DoxX family protein [Bacteroidales bacterium]